MKRELIIECTPDLTRAAVFEDGLLCEIHAEPAKAKKLTESLFLGRVQAVKPSVGAAFVDIGEELNAFLPLKEGQVVRGGELLIVQGAAVQAVETKGLRISDTVNLAGKWLVLVPGGQGVHLSKKIKDQQLRQALMQAVEPICPPGCGLIVRTASCDVTQESLAEEVLMLHALWLSIQQKARGMVSPGLLHAPDALAVRLIRDMGSSLARVTTNDERCLRQLHEVKDAGWLGEQTEIAYFEEKTQLLCDVFSLDAQVDRALRRRVWLNCGGYLVFDACEALTVIDVNSGKMMLGRDLEDTAFRVNMEAAREVARQLRLRDIGGIIIVDYIDMQQAEHKEALLGEIKRLCQQDRAHAAVHSMTKLGLVEMSRKRTGEQLSKSLQSGCKVCDGTGRLLSSGESAQRALRQLRRMVLAGQRGPFLICCAKPVAAALENLTAPSADTPVYALGETGRAPERFEIRQLELAAAPPKGAVQLKKG